MGHPPQSVTIQPYAFRGSNYKESIHKLRRLFLIICFFYHYYLHQPYSHLRCMSQTYFGCKEPLLFFLFKKKMSVNYFRIKKNVSHNKFSHPAVKHKMIFFSNKYCCQHLIFKYNCSIFILQMLHFLEFGFENLQKHVFEYF